MRGLMIYDPSPQPLTAKIIKATARYTERFGKVPDTCMVSLKDHPTGQPDELAGIRIEAALFILPNNVLIGTKD